MSIIKIWNKTSTNYDQNWFVRNNGTGRLEVYLKNKEDAMAIINEAILDTNIERLELTIDAGQITWVRDKEPEPLCECGECTECDDSLENFKRDAEEDDDLEENDPLSDARREDEDFDLNDPRR